MPDYLTSDTDRENFRMAVRNETYRVAHGPLPAGGVERLSIGAYGAHTCNNCGTLFFANEVDPAQNPFQCCSRGKVRIPEPPPYPPALLELREKHKKSLRFLNTKLSLGAYKAKKVNMPGFPWIYKILGQIHVSLDHADPLPDPNDERVPPADIRNPRGRLDLHRRQNAQVVTFVDPELAMNAILGGPGGNTVDPDLLRTFLTFLREWNPLYQSYMRMEELLTQQEAQGVRSEVTLVFKAPGQETVGLRDHTYRLPVATNEVAALFDVGGVPETPAIYIHREGTSFEVLPTHHLRDAFLYPIIFPLGQSGWHQNMRHSGPRVTRYRNRLTLKEFTR
jgi:hypothetical protein